MSVRGERLAAVFALLIACGPGLVAGWVAASPRFKVRQLRVEGLIGEETREHSREALGFILGHSLFLISRNEVQRVIEKDPRIEVISVRKHFPDALILTLRERIPAMSVCKRGTACYYVDRSGRRIGTVSDVGMTGGEQVPELEPASSCDDICASRAIGIVEATGATLPGRDWGVRLIRAVDEDSFEIAFRARPMKMLVSSRDIDRQLAKVSAGNWRLACRRGREVVVDVRFENEVVIRYGAQ